VKLWTDPVTSRKYPVASADSYGVSVVDMTGLLDQGNTTNGMMLLKTFEPIKLEEGKLCSAAAIGTDFLSFLFLKPMYDGHKQLLN